MLVGNKFIVEWVKNKEKIIDYFEFFENDLESKYGEELAENIVQGITKIAMLIDIKDNQNQKEKWLKLKEEIDEKYNKIINKKEYVQDLTKEKIAINKEIGKLDIIISDKHKLREEYNERNKKLDLDKKIFSIKVLQKILNEERRALENKIFECNKKLKPKNYFIEKNDLELKKKMLESLGKVDLAKELEVAICQLEEDFLRCYKIKIRKAKTKEELVNLLYEFRYFCVIPYNFEKMNYEIKENSSCLREIAKLLVQKSIANNVIVKIGTDKKIIEMITKVLFFTNIVKLEDIYIEIKKINYGYYVQAFDESVIDKSYNIEDDKLQIDDANLNKKIKLLN
jgi:hypothetical protein